MIAYKAKEWPQAGTVPGDMLMSSDDPPVGKSRATRKNKTGVLEIRETNTVITGGVGEFGCLFCLLATKQGWKRQARQYAHITLALPYHLWFITSQSPISAFTE